MAINAQSTNYLQNIISVESTPNQKAESNYQ